MIRKKKGQIEWLEFEIFNEEIHHAVFLRHGGVSQNVCTSLNANYKRTGDTIENVRENKRRMQTIFDLKKLISTDAIHDTNIAIINLPKDEYEGCDGLITNKKNWGLLTTHADCQAAIFYDPINKAIANIHAGWRGQVKDIYKKTVETMKTVYGSRPENLLVAISPSLGPQNSEFTNYKSELPEAFWEFQIKPYFFDLWAVARSQLKNCGILNDHIQIAELDTFNNPNDFFSYRRERKATSQSINITGCHGTVVALK